MVPYFGDIKEDATIYLPFNTFDSNDPAGSVTITNLADADIKVHKDGNATPIVTDGATIAIDYAGITGNHLITIDTSADAAYSAGSEYAVRIEGTTVDAGTINAWVAQFSIENRVGHINETARAALEDQFDGTGLTGDTFPSTQAQVGNIATGAGGLSVLITAFAKVGTEPETNTFTATQQGDGVYHIVEDDAPNTDFYYQATVSAGGKATSFEWLGYIQSNGDTTTVWYWDWAGTAYKQITTLSGANGTTPFEEVFKVPIGATGTGADEGKVRLRFLSTTTTAIATDRLLCEFSQASQSVGYANGQIWVDSNSSNTNTVSFVDGVADNVAGSWANAITLSSQVGLTDFHILNGSTIALTGNSDNFSLFGNNWTLQLASRSVAGAYFQGAIVSGVGTSTSEVHYADCEIGTMSVQLGHFDFCSFGGTVTHTLAGDYNYHNCESMIAGPNGPTFAKTAGQVITAQWRSWKGSINLTGLEVGDTLTIGGDELGTIDLGSPAGAVVVEIRGIYKELTNVGSAVVNLDGAINAADVALILADTNELQLDDVPGLIAALKDFDPAVDTVAVVAQVNTLASSAIDAASFATGAITADAFAVNALVAATFAASSLDGKGDWNTVVPDAAGVAPTAIENRAEMDSNSTQLALIVADTNELQTNQNNWVNGGKHWFVATTGSNSNGGRTKGDPLLSPKYAIETAGGEGDTFHIEVGRYGVAIITHNGVARDAGAGTVGIPVETHTFSAGDSVTIVGTSNYNGSETIVSVSANEIVVTATFNSETFSGSTINDGELAVDKGDGTVGIPITSHPFSAGDVVTIRGTSIYDGTWDVFSETTNEIVITAFFISETFSNTDVVTTQTVTSDVPIAVQNGQTILGNGAEDTIIQNTNFFSGVIQINRRSGVTIKGLYLNGVDTSGIGLLVSSGDYLLFEDCRFSGVLDGARCNDINQALFSNCVFTSTYDAAIAYGESVRFVDCTMITSGVKGTESNPPGAFRISSVSDATLNNISITLDRCDLRVRRVTNETHLAVGVQADAFSRLTLIDSTVRVESTHASATGDIVGVNAEVSGRVMIDGGNIESIHAGSGAVLDLKQEASGQILIDPAKTLFDRTKTSGTITQPVAGNTFDTSTDSLEAIRDEGVSERASILTNTATLLTRIPAALFSGITSVAQWLGLMAGKQVGNTTARNEMRATGAGSGTYDETTDSEEAIVDRGNAAWTTGAGGDATEAKQDTIIVHLTDVKGTAFVKDTDSLIDLAHTGADGDTLKSLSDQIDSIVGGAGTGARTVTVTVDDGATVLENATVRFTEGVNTFTGLTNASGVIVFSLDDATYAVSITKDGYSFTPTTKIVNGTEADTYSMSVVAITAPPNAATTTGTMTVYDEEGALEEGVTITVQIIDGPGTDGIGYDSTEWAELSSALGLVEFAGIILGARYKIWRGILKPEGQTFTAPTTGTSFDLAEVIGRG